MIAPDRITQYIDLHDENRTIEVGYVREDRVQALLEAATALRDHLTRWVDGGPPATAEESEAMYTALHKAVLGAGGLDIG